MLSHDRVWAAIDALAARYSLSASGLAKRAGLDSTAFNKSKRLSVGRAAALALDRIAGQDHRGDQLFARRIHRRWSKAAPRPPQAAADAAPTRAAARLCPGRRRRLLRRCRLSGRPGLGPGRAAGAADEGSYALQVQGDSMLPLYRNGDVLIVEPGAVTCARATASSSRPTRGEVMAKVLRAPDRQNRSCWSRSIPSIRTATLPMRDVEWVARIVWASQ